MQLLYNLQQKQQQQQTVLEQARMEGSSLIDPNRLVEKVFYEFSPSLKAHSTRTEQEYRSHATYKK